MSSPQKSNSSCIPFYFAARRRDRTAPQSDSEALKAQQNVDLCAEDLKPAELCRLKRDLELFNAMGCIVTFDKVLKDWATWSWYVFRFLTCSYLMFH